MNGTSPVHVLALSADARPATGWGAFTYHVCEALQRKREVEVTLLVPTDAATQEHEPPFRIEPVLPGWTGNFRRQPQRILEFLHPGQLGFPADLVHALVEFPYGILAVRLARRMGVPSVISGQGTYSVAPLGRVPDRWIFGWALRRADLVSVPSRYTAEMITARLGADLPLRILANGVDADRYAVSSLPGSEVRRRFQIPAGVPVVLSVGALKRRKGMDSLVRSFSRVREQIPEAHLVIAGPGPSAGLLRVCQELSIEAAVHILGEVAEEELVSLYHEADVFALLPRREGDHFEGFGLVYLEAGAAGTPVVGTRSGGVPSAVLDGETGLLVEEEDFEAAASAIVRLLKDRDLARRLGANGRQWAQQNRWEAYADQLVGLYTTLMEEVAKVAATRRQFG